MIAYSSTTNQITLTSNILSAALSTIGTYSTATVTVTNVSANTSVTTNLLTTPFAYIVPNKLTNVIFGLTGTNAPVAGIYKFVYTLILSGVQTVESECLLVDSDVLCSIKDDSTKFIAYLTLRETYFCTCDCDKLYNIYKTATNTYGETNCNC